MSTRRSQTPFKHITQVAGEQLAQSQHSVFAGVAGGDLMLGVGGPLVGTWNGDPLRSYRLLAPSTLRKTWLCNFHPPTEKGPLWMFLPAQVKTQEEAESVAAVCMDLANLRREGA